MVTKALGGGALPLSGGTVTGAITLPGNPSNPLEATPKQYVDDAIAAVVAGIDIKDACYAATTAALTATYSNGASGVGATLTNAGAQAAFSVDGVSPPLNSRILVKNQASTFQNGIYVLTTVGTGATNWVLTRASDYDTVAEIVPGTMVIIDLGTTNAVTSWVQTATVVTIGTDAISFSQLTGAASAPINATYITQTPNGTLTNEQALSALNTGLLKNTTITGVLSIAANGTDYYGPSTPTPVAVSDGGTGRATGTTAYGTICAGTTATGAQQTVSPGTAGKPLVSGGAAALPAYGTLGVDGGGTGVATLTAYAVICGGTSGTNPVQSIAGVGTSGQVLTSNGAGALPTFQSNPAGAGALVFIASVAAAASATVDFTGLDATYDVYTIEASEVVAATDQVDLWGRVGTGGTPTYASGASDYTWASAVSYVTALVGPSAANDAKIVMSGSAVSQFGNSTGENGSFSMSIYKPASTNKYHIQKWELGCFDENGTQTWVAGAGTYKFTTAVTAFRFLFSSGNITSGNFRLYGVKNS